MGNYILTDTTQVHHFLKAMGLVDLKKWAKGILFHSLGQCGKISTIDFFEQNVTSEKFEDYDGEKRKQQSRKPRTLILDFPF
ncbi:hypothetical protein ACQKCU_18300 [Heyndrickxia sporothermodurans]